MPILSNALESEFSSPYFKMNEEICKEFDQFVVENGGQTRGKYNAYSYFAEGIILHKYKWYLQIKKASFSYTNLWLPAKKQSLYVAVKWEACITDFDSLPFQVRTKKAFSRFSKLYSLSWKTHREYSNYMIKAKAHGTPLLEELERTFESLFLSEQVYEISYRNNILVIELRTESNQLDYFEMLLKIEPQK